MSRKILFCILTFAAVLVGQSANGQIASEDFDGGAVNLISGFDTADNIFVSSFPFTIFGAFEVNDFSATMQAPFSLTDDSVVAVSSNGELDPFPGDFEGIFGEARGADDAFFGAVAAGDFNMDFTLDDFMASWTFDVSSAGADPMTLSIDMAQMSNDGFDSVPDNNFVLFEYSIDGGPFQEAMALAAVELVGEPSGFQWRDMDVIVGGAPQNAGIDFGENGTHLGLAVTTPGVTKTLVDTGNAAPNTILNKTPPTGFGAGFMDTYSVQLVGSGSTLELRVSCDFDFEAFAFDNIVISTESGDVLKGDVNLDGTVNLLDVGPFVEVLNNSGNQAEADTNCDGSVNLLDVGPFVEILNGG